MKMIVLTGYDCVEYREAAIVCGANGYVAEDRLNPGELETLITPGAAVITALVSYVVFSTVAHWLDRQRHHVGV